MNGQTVLPHIALKGRQKPDGTKESNAYHIGWLPLISLCQLIVTIDCVFDGMRVQS